MSNYVLGFNEIDKTALPSVGGKGANLGEMSGIVGIRVPGGFCVTTKAYSRIVGAASGFDACLQDLAVLTVDDTDKLQNISARIRSIIENTPIPDDIACEVALHVTELGEDGAYAVRSSATAEDLPTASFAGQQDTYLNIVGQKAILKHIARCWASLFTERAVIYRVQNGFDHAKVQLSVVIQRMVFPDAAGILFTADPITSNRRVVSIDAGFGLGEALVSGLVDADNYKVRDGKIIDKKVATKKLGIFALSSGGTEQRALGADQQNAQVLTDGHMVELAETGRRIEAHFGCPQDIEWCLDDSGFYIVQSRPITTLYPLPSNADDGKNHIYMSLGHQQMMTDTIKPLGLSLLSMFLANLTSQPILEAGGRPYLDVSGSLASRMSSQTFIERGLGSADGLIQAALRNVSKREDFVKELAKGGSTMGLTGGSLGSMIPGFIEAIKVYRLDDEQMMFASIDADNERLYELVQKIDSYTGAALLDFIRRDFAQCYRDIVYSNFGLGVVSGLSPGWVDKNLKKWLGRDKMSDFFTQSLSSNVTSEMGLDLLDVADVVRQHPSVRDYLQNPDDEAFFESMELLDGGLESADALRRYLEKYGARCPGEIDISRTRWIERPSLLAPMILSNIRSFEAGAHAAILEQKRREVDERITEVIDELKRQPGGSRKAKKAARQISLLRHFAGFREYPKFAMIKRFLVYKQALLKEANRMLDAGLIHEQGDIFYLHFDELEHVLATGQLDYGIIKGRKASYEVFDRLGPPRVLTSEGEEIRGGYDVANAPEGALSGVAASAGVVEGRARVVLKLEDAHLEAGDILVTSFTDPSWTAVFVSAAGLVAEVGGMMTHGAVVAREYGIPAVVSVDGAVTAIKDGQQIRVNGTGGYVELLDQ